MNAVATNELAFLESRRKYLGGSDIAALLGIAPTTWRRNSPLALYLDKIEPPKVDTQNVRVKRRGKRWEGVVGEMMVEKLVALGHTVEIVATNQRYTDPEFPFFACEIDWEIRLDNEPELTNVELKTVHPYKVSEWGEEDTDASPIHYTAQGHWGWGITNRISPRRRIIIAPLFGADEIRIYPIQPAPELIADIRETARKFWIENVEARVPPLPGGLVDLARLFPKDCGRTLELGNNLKFVDAIAELRDIEDEWKAIEKRWEAAEFIAKEAMADAAVATIGGNKACTWKAQSQSNIDVKRLREEQPQIAAAYERKAEFRKFLLTKVKVK